MTTGNKLTVEDPQIVNGLQTSYQIFNFFKNITSFPLSKFSAEDIKKLKELVGLDFPKIQGIEPEKLHYKSLSFQEEEIFNIKNKLDRSGNEESKKLREKLDEIFLNDADNRHVLVRIINPENDTIRDNIIKATNSQTMIPPGHCMPLIPFIEI